MYKFSKRHHSFFMFQLLCNWYYGKILSTSLWNSIHTFNFTNQIINWIWWYLFWFSSSNRQVNSIIFLIPFIVYIFFELNVLVDTFTKEYCYFIKDSKSNKEHKSDEEKNINKIILISWHMHSCSFHKCCSVMPDHIFNPEECCFHWRQRTILKSKWQIFCSFHKPERKTELQVWTKNISGELFDSSLQIILLNILGKVLDPSHQIIKLFYAYNWGFCVFF